MYATDMAASRTMMLVPLILLSLSTIAARHNINTWYLPIIHACFQLVRDVLIEMSTHLCPLASSIWHTITRHTKSQPARTMRIPPLLSAMQMPTGQRVLPLIFHATRPAKPRVPAPIAAVIMARAIGLSGRPSCVASLRDHVRQKTVTRAAGDAICHRFGIRHRRFDDFYVE